MLAPCIETDFFPQQLPGSPMAILMIKAASGVERHLDSPGRHHGSEPRQ